MTIIVTEGPRPGHPILVEVESAPGADGVADEYADVEVRGERLRRLRHAGSDLVLDGLELVRGCAERVAGMVAATAEAARPDELEVQLSIKLDYELGAVLVGKSTAGAQLQVTMRWQTERP
jgi:hypothetical protein